MGRRPEGKGHGAKGIGNSEGRMQPPAHRDLRLRPGGKSEKGLGQSTDKIENSMRYAPCAVRSVATRERAWQKLLMSFALKR